MNHKLTIVLLVLTHAICGVLVGFITDTNNGPRLLLAVYMGLFFSQTSLLGIWVGLATPRWPIRLLVFLIGIAYLGLQFWFSLSERNLELVSLAFLTTIAATGVMLGIRRFVAQLERSSKESLLSKTEGIRFSLRQLMLLTLCLCIALTVGRLLQPSFGLANEDALILTLCACFVSFGVASAWAMLGTTNLSYRSFVILVLGLPMGYILSIYWGNEWWFWSTMMVLESACLLGSLYIVRQCGFRLVRHSPASN